MAEEKDLLEAKSVFDTLCQTLDDQNLKYDKKAEEFRIACNMQGDDLVMPLDFRVIPEKHSVLLTSPMPFHAPEDKRLEMAVAVSMVNNRLVDGCFDYDVRDGELLFRIGSSYMESAIGKELFLYLLICAVQTIDDYNDKFLLLANGMMTLEQFMNKFNAD